MCDPVRRAAIEILLHLDQPIQTLDACLEERVTETLFPSRRDRNFIYALVFGVLRYRGRLDWILSRCSDKPLKKIDPPVLTCLRVGLFQVLLMDRVPESAAVNTSVALAKKMAGHWTGGFVNAVLRKAVRRGAQIKYPGADKSSVDYLAAYYSLPGWLVERWHRTVGKVNALDLARGSIQRAPFTLRTNRLKCSRTELIGALEKDEFQVVPGQFTPDSIHVVNAPKPVMETQAFADGWVQVQDEAAQLVSELLSPRPGETVMDACAGLGGKTGHIAQLMANQGTLLAMDRGGEKLDRLRTEMVRLGIKIVTRREQDITCAIDPGLKGQFDRVLVDAPCSGLGVIRRNPDVKWRVTPSILKQQGFRQSQLLYKAAEWVKPQGTLVYSVCSTEPEETHEVLQRFLKKRPDYKLTPASEALPSVSRQLATADGLLQTDFARYSMDGFFAVRLLRKREAK